jgi:hypothetical protein
MSPVLAMQDKLRLTLDSEGCEDLLPVASADPLPASWRVMDDSEV